MSKKFVKISRDDISTKSEYKNLTSTVIEDALKGLNRLKKDYLTIKTSSTINIRVLPEVQISLEIPVSRVWTKLDHSTPLTYNKKIFVSPPSNKEFVKTSIEKYNFRSNYKEMVYLVYNVSKNVYVPTLKLYSNDGPIITSFNGDKDNLLLYRTPDKRWMISEDVIFDIRSDQVITLPCAVRKKIVAIIDSTNVKSISGKQLDCKMSLNIEFNFESLPVFINFNNLIHLTKLQKENQDISLNGNHEVDRSTYFKLILNGLNIILIMKEVNKNDLEKMIAKGKIFDTNRFAPFEYTEAQLSLDYGPETEYFTDITSDLFIHFKRLAMMSYIWLDKRNHYFFLTKQVNHDDKMLSEIFKSSFTVNSLFPQVEDNLSPVDGNEIAFLYLLKKRITELEIDTENPSRYRYILILPNRFNSDYTTSELSIPNEATYLLILKEENTVVSFHRLVQLPGLLDPVGIPPNVIKEFPFNEGQKVLRGICPKCRASKDPKIINITSTLDCDHNVEDPTRKPEVLKKYVSFHPLQLIFAGMFDIRDKQTHSLIKWFEQKNTFFCIPCVDWTIIDLLISKKLLDNENDLINGNIFFVTNGFIPGLENWLHDKIPDNNLEVSVGNGANYLKKDQNNLVSSDLKVSDTKLNKFLNGIIKPSNDTQKWEFNPDSKLLIEIIQNVNIDTKTRYDLQKIRKIYLMAILNYLFKPYDSNDDTSINPMKRYYYLVSIALDVLGMDLATCRKPTVEKIKDDSLYIPDSNMEYVNMSEDLKFRLKRDDGNVVAEGNFEEALVVQNPISLTATRKNPPYKGLKYKIPHSYSRLNSEKPPFEFNGIVEPPKGTKGQVKVKIKQLGNVGTVYLHTEDNPLRPAPGLHQSIVSSRLGRYWYPSHSRTGSGHKVYENTRNNKNKMYIWNFEENNYSGTWVESTMYSLPKGLKGNNSIIHMLNDISKGNKAAKANYQIPIQHFKELPVHCIHRKQERWEINYDEPDTMTYHKIVAGTSMYLAYPLKLNTTCVAYDFDKSRMIDSVTGKSLNLELEVYKTTNENEKVDISKITELTYEIKAEDKMKFMEVNGINTFGFVYPDKTVDKPIPFHLQLKPNTQGQFTTEITGDRKSSIIGLGGNTFQFLTGLPPGKGNKGDNILRKYWDPVPKGHKGNKGNEYEFVEIEYSGYKDIFKWTEDTSYPNVDDKKDSLFPGFSYSGLDDNVLFPKVPPINYNQDPITANPASWWWRRRRNRGRNKGDKGDIGPPVAIPIGDYTMTYRLRTEAPAPIVPELTENKGDKGDGIPMAAGNLAYATNPDELMPVNSLNLEDFLPRPRRSLFNRISNRRNNEHLQKFIEEHTPIPTSVTDGVNTIEFIRLCLPAPFNNNGSLTKNILREIDKIINIFLEFRDNFLPKYYDNAFYTVLISMKHSIKQMLTRWGYKDIYILIDPSNNYNIVHLTNDELHLHLYSLMHPEDKSYSQQVLLALEQINFLETTYVIFGKDEIVPPLLLPQSREPPSIQKYVNQGDYFNGKVNSDLMRISRSQTQVYQIVGNIQRDVNRLIRILRSPQEINSFEVIRRVKALVDKICSALQQYSSHMDFLNEIIELIEKDAEEQIAQQGERGEGGMLDLDITLGSYTWFRRIVCEEVVDELRYDDIPADIRDGGIENLINTINQGLKEINKFSILINSKYFNNRKVIKELMNKHLPYVSICFPKGCAYMGEGRVSVSPSWDPYLQEGASYDPMTGLPRGTGYFVGVPPDDRRHDLRGAQEREIEYRRLLRRLSGDNTPSDPTGILVLTGNFITGTHDTSSPFSPSNLNSSPPTDNAKGPPMATSMIDGLVPFDYIGLQESGKGCFTNRVSRFADPSRTGGDTRPPEISEAEIAAGRPANMTGPIQWGRPDTPDRIQAEINAAGGASAAQMAELELCDQHPGGPSDSDSEAPPAEIAARRPDLEYDFNDY